MKLDKNSSPKEQTTHKFDRRNSHELEKATAIIRLMAQRDGYRIPLTTAKALAAAQESTIAGIVVKVSVDDDEANLTFGILIADDLEDILTTRAGFVDRQMISVYVQTLVETCVERASD